MTATSASAPADRSPWWVAAGEIGFILLLFYLQAGSPPPDVNEAHYLAKAKHFWDPAWCHGDRFLESADAHWMFYFTLGQLTRVFDLPTAAWVGRFLTWILLAFGWRRLCRAVAPPGLNPLAWLAAGIALVLWHRFHMAGEWVVGGVEAKSTAYGFAFLSLAEAARNRTPQALAWAGVSAAFHVLVGGWLMIAIGLAWLVSGRERCSWMVFAVAGAFAVLLATPGWLPAIRLTRGVPAEIVTAANNIYVYERLSHHLVFHRFDHGFMLRHLLLLVIGGLLWRFGAPSAGLRRIYLIVAGAMFIAAAGIVLDQALLYYPDLAAKLLRYYFFRLSDAMLPIGVALGVVQCIAGVESRRPRLGVGLKIAASAIVAVHLLFVASPWETHLPPAVDQSLPRPRTAPLRLWGPGAEWANEEAPEEPGVPAPSLTTPAEHAAWFAEFREVCAWIAAETPPDALFLTARGQQTFKWYAGRPEVVSWKDMPQDAVSLVNWFAVWNDVHAWENGPGDLAGASDERLRELGTKYGAKFVLLDRTRGGVEHRLPRVYPTEANKTSRFEVYRLE